MRPLQKKPVSLVSQGSSLLARLSLSRKRSLLTLKALIFIILSLASQSSLALKDRTFCVWDPVGRTGPVMTFYSDVIPKAQAWGLNIRFVAYTEETDAVKQFKAGNCEAVVITSILSRQFVQFAGTMDAIGAINSQEGLELAIATLAREKAGNLMIDGPYEVVTTFPIGSMYAFVKDRRVNDIDGFAGKRLAILNDDPQMKMFADLAGSKKVNVTLSNFADKFKSGEVEILVMPALAYNTFELYHGLGQTGGIIDYRLYYGMLQTISRRDQFPDDFGNNMRNYMLTRLKEMNKMVKDAEEEIPEHYWIKTTQFTKDSIEHFSKRVRMSLQDNDVNNVAALKLFWKIRCRLDPSRGECKESPDLRVKRDLVAEKKREEEEKLALEKRKREQERLAALERQREQERLAEEARLKQEQEKQAQQQSLQANITAAPSRAATPDTQAIQEELRLQQERIAQEKARLEAERQRLEEERLALERAKQALQQESSKSETPITETSETPTQAQEESETSEDKPSRSIWQILFGWMWS